MRNSTPSFLRILATALAAYTGSLLSDVRPRPGARRVPYGTLGDARDGQGRTQPAAAPEARCHRRGRDARTDRIADHIAPGGCPDAGTGCRSRGRRAKR